MPVPWEAVLPMGIVVVMFGVTGSGFSLAKRLTNDGKPPRWGLDDWDRMMMQRDERLTGKFRVQAAQPEAPPEFSVNSAWSTERIRLG
ncbi:unnamed protein product [Tilletia controversa]|uniref:NADH dehydrogenase [ubiquinone] 1 alpha subcomplex subunit 1 n=4 Tax=Tilletia TaxID=13289 RepID=A0A8X7MVJ4_9BASI|nr:hypothetical protein CF328_g4751 [Tilletia controversa]KAE8197607.1 hypothetical protein CF336_g2074 [Tilletia laevis]KAE8263518.1 hypothetical protein A4X03_0g1619 [Tilletia caries]KAE8207086.1 hypothetical protein CF335_g1404 [Tilletia laevis]KAE8248774.1 hypothetical protein A4X06_0g3532 [Tilletia controversa]